MGRGGGGMKGASDDEVNVNGSEKRTRMGRACLASAWLRSEFIGLFPFSVTLGRSLLASFFLR